MNLDWINNYKCLLKNINFDDNNINTISDNSVLNQQWFIKRKMDSELHTTQNSSTISEQKYINLRKRLDQLGYRQTLGIESLPLIEKLFNDLVHTTESLKKSKLEVRFKFKLWLVHKHKIGKHGVFYIKIHIWV